MHIIIFATKKNDREKYLVFISLYDMSSIWFL